MCEKFLNYSKNYNFEKTLFRSYYFIILLDSTIHKKTTINFKKYIY